MKVGTNIIANLPRPVGDEMGGNGILSNITTGFVIKRDDVPSKARYWILDRATKHIVHTAVSNDDGEWSATGLNPDRYYLVLCGDETRNLNSGSLDWVKPEEIPEPTSTLDTLAVDQHYPIEGYGISSEYVVFIGAGFSDQISVDFGSDTSPDIVVKNQNVMYAQVPTPSVVDTVDIVIDRGGNTITLTDGFDFLKNESLNILNGDAEDGMNNWTITDSGVTTVTNPANDVGPLDGACFYGGDSDSFSKANQTVDLPSSFYTEIDASDAQVRLSWYQSSYSDSDQAEISYEFLDGSDVSIGGEVSNGLIATTEDAWTFREYIFDVPPNARKIIFYMVYNRTAGSNNNGYIDDITANIIEKAG